MSAISFCHACNKSVLASNFARHKRTKEHLDMFREMLKKDVKLGKSKNMKFATLRELKCIIY